MSAIRNEGFAQMEPQITQELRPSVIRRGLRREPDGGWPLDRLFVGVGTLRVMREMVKLTRDFPGTPQRAWDVALWSGLTPQGAAKSLARPNHLGLVRRRRPDPGHAPSFRLDLDYPLIGPLIDLFDAERAWCRRVGTLGRREATGAGLRQPG